MSHWQRPERPWHLTELFLRKLDQVPGTSASDHATIAVMSVDLARCRRNIPSIYGTR